MNSLTFIDGIAVGMMIFLFLGIGCNIMFEIFERKFKDK